MTSSELRRVARENLSGNWGISVGVALVAAILGGTIAGFGSNVNFNINEDTIRNLPPFFWTVLLPVVSVAGLLGIVSFIIGGVVELGYAKFLLKQHDKKELQFSDLFSQFDRFGTGFAQQFLRILYTTLWTLLFIIPGIVKSLSYAMTPFILEDHPEMTASEAIKASMKLMDGHKMDLFILGLSFIGWSLLACLTMGIGYLFLTPYINAAYAAFYRNISGQRQEARSYVPPVEF
ncbi:MAG: DUF975 family protein [Firmicutes bacterium]|nr:DUF975 family protein [Clostridiales bacterium]MDD5883352.1 DUF975 family protein [Bacillota bacterium]